jgi:hypothetical protein
MSRNEHKFSPQKATAILMRYGSQKDLEIKRESKLFKEITNGHVIKKWIEDRKCND